MSSNRGVHKTPLQVWLVAIAAYIAGFAALESALFSRFPRPFEVILPVNVVDYSHVLSVAIGISLLYFGNQLIKRKHMAFLLTIVGLSALIVFELIWLRNPLQIVLYSLLIAFLYLNRGYFSVKSDSVRLKSSFHTVAILLVIVLAYGTIGFLLMDERGFGIEISILHAFRSTLTELFTYSSGAPAPTTRYAQEFIRSLDLAGFMVLILSLLALFRPLRYHLTYSQRDRYYAEQLLKKWPGSTEDYFKLWPEDKHYFFEAGRRGFIAYKVSRGIALVIDGPSGDPSIFKQMWSDFMEFCTINAWRVAIIHGDDASEKLYKPWSFKKQFIGNEAIINSGQFVSDTIKSKHFRYVRNKAERDELSVELWQAPLDSKQLSELKFISDSWLMGNRKEYTFIMGYFEERSLRQNDVAILKKNQQIIAYTNILPSFVKHAATIDQMRHLPKTSPVAMHFLFMRLIEMLHDKGVEKFNLGYVPLAGMDKLTDQTAPQKLENFFVKMGLKFHSTGGLEQFKNKFSPDWEPRYLYYQGNVQSLVPIGLSLDKAVSYKHKPTHHHY